jgi:hypothetical protein
MPGAAVVANLTFSFVTGPEANDDREWSTEVLVIVKRWIPGDPERLAWIAHTSLRYW